MVKSSVSMAGEESPESGNEEIGSVEAKATNMNDSSQGKESNQDMQEAAE